MSGLARHAPRSDVVWHAGCLSRTQRWRLTGQCGVTVWFTGLPAAGKSTLAYAAEARLVGVGRAAYVLDGDNLRHGLNIDLGFDRAARAENVRRTAEAAAMLCDAGVVTLVSLVSPYAADRARARTIHGDAGLAFLEVHVATRPALCERRDPKGLYRRARLGEIRGLTGVDAPYEPPAAPDVVVGGEGESIAISIERVLAGIENSVGCAFRSTKESASAADTLRPLARAAVSCRHGARVAFAQYLVERLEVTSTHSFDSLLAVVARRLSAPGPHVPVRLRAALRSLSSSRHRGAPLGAGFSMHDQIPDAIRNHRGDA